MHPRTAELLCLPLIDLSTPRTVTMLDGLSPQAGKIWKKAILTFSLDGKQMTETFLICNTGSHAAILGLKWLDAHNPEIDWNQRTLSFPHKPLEHVAIAREEEANKNPLEGVPSKYHKYAKVFGERNSTSFPLTGITILGLSSQKKVPELPSVQHDGCQIHHSQGLAQGQVESREDPP
ncbi:hypothetical protein RHS01_05012 [Rhizoctonia solani]|uniref:Uncharacterized protein n=1 Tax=Rhizoctonia solani TaxID=456999 RepID=A0A8H7IE66_9AGAM|nr:hypothetical protein RHS01_05012 [Rhizoctonia solani]